MPKNYGTCSDPLDVPRKQEVEEAKALVAGKYSADNPPPYPVTSVNSKTGVVSLNASDVEAVSVYGGTMDGPLFAEGGEGVSPTVPQMRNECFLSSSAFDAAETGSTWGDVFSNESCGICWKYE